MIDKIKSLAKAILPIFIQPYVKHLIIKYNIDISNKSASTKASIKIQNSFDVTKLTSAKCCSIFLIPAEDIVSGGVVSIYNFVAFTREIVPNHVCILSTTPGTFTLAQNSKFKNTENIYRWEQITTYCTECEEMVIHIPEYFSSFFYASLKASEKEFLKAIPLLRINILNQNIKLMPNPDELKPLYALTSNISQSSGKAGYANQFVCDKYQCPLYYIPSYVDLEQCNIKNYDEKRKLILYSNDRVSDKQTIIKKVQNALFDYEIYEINNISYEEYFNLIAEAKFTISFGEGFDGYYIQPYFAHSIGITVFDAHTFPDKCFIDLPFVYNSYAEMYERICVDIIQTKDNKEKYEAISFESLHFLRKHVKPATETIHGLEIFYKQMPSFVVDK